jgi:hypothetical protein
MNNKKQKDVKEELAKDLRSLAQILFDAGIITDKSPLEQAAGNCATGKPEIWEYWMSNLIIIVTKYIPEYKNTIPASLSELVIEFNMHIRGEPLEQSCVEDPIRWLSADWRISSNPHVTSWHLDRNQGLIDDECKHFAHPIYHFQFGGNHLHSAGPYGQLLFVEPPRLAHPPMDAILAIDFTISNFLPDIWHELRSEDSEDDKIAQRAERYVRILRTAQKRFWRPYAFAAASQWILTDAPSSGSFTRPQKLIGREVWPQVVGH